MPDISKILSNTYTIEELYARLSIAREALENYFFKGSKEHTGGVRGGVSNYLRSSSADDTDKRAVLEWGDAFFGAFTSDNVYDVLHSLWDTVEDLPRITIYTAVDIKGSDLEPVARWARKNLGDKMIIEVRVDRETVAGCVFDWRGKRYDYSVRRALEEKREEVKEMIKSV